MTGSRRAWVAWWSLMPVCLMIQWPDRTVLASTTFNWAAWAVLAGVLGCMDTAPARRSVIPLAGFFLFLASLNYFWKVFPRFHVNGWFESWGVVSAFGSTTCWLAVVLFGTIMAVRHSPNFSKRVGIYLLGFHGICLMVSLMHDLGIWSWWFRSENPGGFFPSRNAWSATAVVSVPILASWRRWAMILPIAVVVLSRSLTAWAVLGILGLWKFRSDKRVLAICGSVFLIGTFWFWMGSEYSRYAVGNMIRFRVDAWMGAIQAIVSHPFGLGWEPSGYQDWVARNFSKRMLPHPASDVLWFVASNGWVSIPLVGWIAYKVSKLGSRPFDLAVVGIASFALFQRSLSAATFGIFAWAVWIFWKINREEVR